ncbi:hypothetical protein HMPREF3213_00009 [Heyndrickxia coagulans]|uniref:Uncharacterized protein n=1 Tax=Heyndrickxia coagulans TaxID=1398 RepID=A0A133L3S2_HEYCO|nr:hypothetical protein HMPREF3213_00009 [Heyndrickxia coagulans]
MDEPIQWRGNQVPRPLFELFLYLNTIRPRTIIQLYVGRLSTAAYFGQWRLMIN